MLKKQAHIKLFVVLGSLVAALGAVLVILTISAARLPWAAVTRPLAAEPISAVIPSRQPLESISAATVVATDTEMLVVEYVAQTACGPYPVGGIQYYVVSDTYSFSCMVSAGHLTDASVQRFSDPAEARAAFDAKRQDNPIENFHCCPASEWQYHQYPGNGFLHRYHIWQSVRWLIVSHSFDDTGYLIAPAPRADSEAAYRAATTYGLFPGEMCFAAYLPLVLRH